MAGVRTRRCPLDACLTARKHDMDPVRDRDGAGGGDGGWASRGEEDAQIYENRSNGEKKRLEERGRTSHVDDT